MYEKLKEKYLFGGAAGYVATNMERVRFFWSTETVERAPLIYNAGIVLILQGRKVGWLGTEEFHYDPDHYLVLSVPLPFECATFATSTEPMLGLFIDVDPVDLAELVNLEGTTYAGEATSTLGVRPLPMSAEMRDAISRLIEALSSDILSKVTGHGVLREITYRVLSDQHGPSLRDLTRQGSHYARISKSIVHIRANFAQQVSVEALAKDAGMSEGAFHRAFKTITGTTPHKYLKSTRLHRARALMVAEGLPVAVAAQRVGYDSAPHFSREFKQFFNVSPKDAQTVGYRPTDI